MTQNIKVRQQIITFVYLHNKNQLLKIVFNKLTSSYHPIYYSLFIIFLLLGRESCQHN